MIPSEAREKTKRIRGLMIDVVTRSKPIEVFEEHTYQELYGDIDRSLSEVGTVHENSFHTLGEWRGYAMAYLKTYRERRGHVASLYQFSDVVERNAPTATSSATDTIGETAQLKKKDGMSGPSEDILRRRPWHRLWWCQYLLLPTVSGILIQTH